MATEKISKMARIAEKCLVKAVREELQRKALLGQYVIISRNGKTCRVSARQALKIARSKQNLKGGIKMRLRSISTLTTTVVVFWIFSFLAGCTGSPVQTGWRASDNKKTMVHVRPDMSVDEVSKIMGPPDKTELYRGKNNEAILVYLYITEGMDLYSRQWNESNYTPFIFINDRLHGWGWPNLEATAQKYEFVIKER